MGFRPMYPYLRVSDLPKQIPLGPQKIRLGDTGYFVTRQCYREENPLKRTTRLYVVIDRKKRALLGYPDEPHVLWGQHHELPATACLIDQDVPLTDEWTGEPYEGPPVERRLYTDAELYHDPELKKIQDMLYELRARCAALSFKSGRPVGILGTEKGLYLVDLQRFDGLPAERPKPEEPGGPYPPHQMARLIRGGSVIKKFSYPTHFWRSRAEQKEKPDVGQ